MQLTKDSVVFFILFIYSFLSVTQTDVSGGAERMAVSWRRVDSAERTVPHAHLSDEADVQVAH